MLLFYIRKVYRVAISNLCSIGLFSYLLRLNLKNNYFYKNNIGQNKSVTSLF